LANDAKGADPCYLHRRQLQVLRNFERCEALIQYGETDTSPTASVVGPVRLEKSKKWLQ